MKEDKIERLFEKYKEGNSTLEEEQFLFNHFEDSKFTMKAWFTFVKKNKKNKKKIPNNFNDILWESFQSKKNKKRRKFIGAISAAASVVILISFFMTSPKQEKLSYSEKEDLLNQALNMVSNSELSENQQTIIYENKMIIIYTKP